MTAAWIDRRRVAEMRGQGWSVVETGERREGCVRMVGPELPERGWRQVGEVIEGMARREVG